MNRSLRGALAIALIALSTGCSRETTKSPASRKDAGATTTLIVFAASSLTESFTTVAHVFETAHPGTSVRLVFGPSTDLARQIVDGADADVYAAASSQSVATLTAAKLTGGEPKVFARNRLEIAVPAGNPAHIASLADLTRGGVKFAQCAVEVPCGAAAKKLLGAVGVTAAPATYERDVKAVLAKVRLGEVDAGLVYRTDVRAETRSGSAKVAGIEIAESAKAVNDYPIVLVKRSKPNSAAAAFVAYVTSPAGRAVFVDAGFDAP